jgi:hypothetical protein
MNYGVIADRVARNVGFAPELDDPNDRLAASWLFSFLSDVEKIAVLASERGDGVEGQLEDEIVHRDTFAEVARKYGGLRPTSRAVREITSYLADLKGPASQAVLNVVCECWLEGVFHHLGRWGFADKLFREVEGDETRHVVGAIDGAGGVNPDEILPMVRRIERLLAQVASDPGFAIPLYHFGGIERYSAIGRASVANHRRACGYLGIEAGEQIRDLTAASRAAVLSRRLDPEPLPLTPWEQTRSGLWYETASQIGINYFPLRQLSSWHLEALFVRALAMAFESHPRVRAVFRNGGLYWPKTVKIGIRRKMRGRGIVAVHVDNPHRLETKQVKRLVVRRLRRLRKRPYESLPAVPRELVDLVPPSRTLGTVVWNGRHDGMLGIGPPIEAEGVPVEVSICGYRGAELGWMMRADHRVMDGDDFADLGAFVAKAVREQAA